MRVKWFSCYGSRDCSIVLYTSAESWAYFWIFSLITQASSPLCFFSFNAGETQFRHNFRFCFCEYYRDLFASARDFCWRICQGCAVYFHDEGRIKYTCITSRFSNPFPHFSSPSVANRPTSAFSRSGMRARASRARWSRVIHMPGGYRGTTVAQADRKEPCAPSSRVIARRKP